MDFLKKTIKQTGVISIAALKGALFLIMILLLGITCFVVEGIKWMFDTWPKLTMEELVYQIFAPVQGTNTDMIIECFSKCVAPALILMILILIVVLGVKKHWAKNFIAIITCVFCGFIIINNVEYAWKRLDITEYLKAQSTQSYYIEDNYVDPRSVNITFPEQKRNLIYLFLESMESTYASTEVGGAYIDNYIPELTQLAFENANFSRDDRMGGLNVLDGATWTMGGMVAQTSGLPLKINLRGDYIEDDIEVLPNAWTIGDVLGEQGYKNVLMIGSDGTFAGRKQYFEKHGNYEVLDYYTAKDNGWIPDDYFVFWGYEDLKLFDYAKQKLIELSNDIQPFNFTMLTVDTHFEDGYVCDQCVDVYGNQYANVLACSSRQIMSFIQWIQEQPFYQNTTIVLVGDHLTMDSDFCNNIDPNYTRGVYNVFINAPQNWDHIKWREGTTMDMFPTTLAALGATIDGNRLALGTNLFSGEPTLVEQQGVEQVNKGMRDNSLFYSLLAGERVDDTAMDMK